MPARRHKTKRRKILPDDPRTFGPIRLPNESLWFVLVSVLDYVMTYLVLYFSEMQASPLRHRLTESNPLAAYFIDRWGLEKGLLGFKLGLVATICLITQRIAVHQPRVGRWVLNLGTLLTTAVVIYSLSLLLRAYE